MNTKNDYANGLTSGMIFILAVACGSIVANLYYAQTLIVLIGKYLKLNVELEGLIVTFTQIGYGVGLLFIVPLADIIENKRLIILLLCLTSIFLFSLIIAPTGIIFLLCCFLLGITAVATQIIVPLIAHFTPLEKRGKTIGSVTSGLLFGIMLARPLASWIAHIFMWQAIFVFSAILMLIIAIIMYCCLPTRIPEHKISYKQLIGSLPGILKSYPVLQRRAAYHAMLFAVFSLFWTSVAMLLMGGDYHYSQAQVALFAFAGALGALIAPVAGHVADRGFTRIATGGAIFVVAIACIVAKLYGEHSIVILAISAIVLDAGVSFNLVLGQRAIYALAPNVRGRLNGLYMSIFFMGGAIGSALTGYLYKHGGWHDITSMGIIISTVAFIYFLSECLQSKT